MGVLLNLALAALIGWVAVSAFDTVSASVEPDLLPAPVAEDAGASGSMIVATIEAPPLAAFDDISARPLFSETRARREAPVRVASVPRQTPMPSVELTGVFIMSDLRQAFVRQADGQMQILRIGDQIKGWRLAEVGPGKAIFANGDREQTVLMGEDAKPGSSRRKVDVSDSGTTDASPIGTLIPNDWD